MTSPSSPFPMMASSADSTIAARCDCGATGSTSSAGRRPTGELIAGTSRTLTGDGPHSADAIPCDELRFGLLRHGAHLHQAGPPAPQGLRLGAPLRCVERYRVVRCPDASRSRDP